MKDLFCLGNVPEEKDIMDILIEAQDDENGAKLTDPQVLSNCITVFLAGHDTLTSGKIPANSYLVALSFIIFAVANHKEVQAKLAKEIDDVLQGNLPTAENVNNLRYLGCVIRESLRLYPPAPALAREVASDCTIGGYFIEVGF